jgi:hypothetical protein
VITSMLRLKFVLIVLLLPAFICRALIPVGFMPKTEDHFSVELKICPGHLGHHAGDGAPRPNAPGQDHPCVYSAGTASAPPATLLAGLAPITFLIAPVVITSASISGRELDRTHLARGPPLT